MISLWPHQEEAVEELRDGLRRKIRTQLLCVPTGGGKTVIAAFLTKAAQEKERRVVFLVDRVALAGQTSATFWEFGIQHGVAQGSATFGRNEPIQICSAQTLEKRGSFPACDLLIVDEAHTLRQFTTDFIQNTNTPVIGLTATPFSKGLGSIYQKVINVTTTDELIEQGYLAPLKAYCAREIDMSGAKTTAGEWRGSEVEDRGRAIIGDIASEWIAKTNQHFGGPVKTIVFSATVAHGEEICREFQQLGYNFQQISYRDRDDDERKQKIEEFRAGEIQGLVSCEALAKGFDVQDILCLICARPYRKSFSSHIQMLGRAMRSSPGKDYALLLDHAGNYLGFYDRMIEFFANGCDSLDDGERDDKVREEPEEQQKKDMVCSCGMVVPPSADRCPGCGKDFTRSSEVEIRPGEMVDMDGKPSKKDEKPFLRDRKSVYQQLAYEALTRKKGDIDKAKSFAKAQYKNFYGCWPPFTFEPASGIDPELKSAVTANIIRYVLGQQKRKKKAAKA